jgi:hypothetical protein
LNKWFIVHSSWFIEKQGAGSREQVGRRQNAGGRRQKEKK